MKFGDIDGFWWLDTQGISPIEVKVTNTRGDRLVYTFTENTITPNVILETTAQL